MFVLLCTLCQSSLPYHTAGVDSNDELYGGSEEYNEELKILILICSKEIKQQLLDLKGNVQCPCALLFISQLIERIVMTPSVCSFILEIFNQFPIKVVRGNEQFMRKTLKQLEVEVLNMKSLYSDLSDLTTIQMLLNLIEKHLHDILQ